jgi:hypothetical protein
MKEQRLMMKYNESNLYKACQLKQGARKVWDIMLIRKKKRKRWINQF